MFLEGYAIDELIAASDRNSVRRARRASDGRRVIVKTSTTEYPTARDLRRLEFEYRVLERLQVPGVIAVLGIERHAGRVALILEDFGGDRLPVVPGKGVSLELFFTIARGIVEALSAVHARGVIHKDVNPRNVLLNRETGVVKLIDFSLASELERELADAVPCKDLEGTLPYVSPEQTGRMNRDLDFRTDYYSLGVTFFELLTGSLPFSAPDVLGYVHCHLSKQPPNAHERNVTVPEGLAAIVAKLMAKNPDERYASASGLLWDLARAERSFRESHDVPPFTLGERDVSERFLVSQALVGREREISRLLAAFEQASDGPARLLLVSGYSGSGKSSLVRELYRPIVEKRGNFVTGKFEQLERNTPYGALAQALRSLLKQLLTDREERLLAHKRRLELALGSEAAVLEALLPELGRILGPQPPVAELPAREAQLRLERLFRRLLGALATKAQPLVVFLDDLQWTDGSTPELLVELLADDDLRHVLLLGAYRSNEVSENHLLRAALLELQQKRPAALEELELGPLGEPALAEVVEKTLRIDGTRARPLVAILLQKTGGNPFFASELLYRWHSQGAIAFDPRTGTFVYDDAAIAKASFSENVVELMLERLRELPAKARELVQVAACIGNEFELSFLARLTGESANLVATALWPAVEQRVLLPKGDDYRLLGGESDLAGEAAMRVRYRFSHDRVMQAAYELSSPDERARLHLGIGRRLRDDVPAPARHERVFEFIDHLNLARSLLVVAEERDELAELNVLAALRARRSAAYRTAIGYLDAAEVLLSTEEWAARAARRFELCHARVECTFLSGQVDVARSLAEELLALSPDRPARARARRLAAQIEEQRSQLGEAVAIIVLGLRELGLELPAEPALVEKGIGEGIGKLLGHLERVSIEDLAKLPALEDPERLAMTDLLFQLIPPASQMNPPLFILAELILFDLALTHGTVPGSAKNFMDCGIVLGAILKDYPRAYRMGKVAFAMLEQRIPTPLESAVNFVFGCFISHWGAHFQEGLDALEQGHRRGVELGDTLHASYSIVHHAKSSFFAGQELAACRARAELAHAYTRAIGAVGHAAVPRMLERALAELEARDHVDLTLSEDAFRQEIEKTGNDHFLFVLGQIQTLVHLVLGDWDAATRWSGYVAERLGVGNGSFPVPDYYLFAALVECRKARSADAAEQSAALARVEEHVTALAVFERACPANFAHKRALAAAELARTRGASIDEVLPLYAQALATAGDDVLHLRALCYELQAEFWQEKSQPQLARECLLEAYHLYRHWGARAKVARLGATHRDWIERATATRGAAPRSVIDTMVTATVTTGVEGSSLDVQSALKATHAISSEVKAERLFSVLVQTIIENAGAEHGYLIVQGDGSEALSVAAMASVAGNRHGVELPVPLESFESIAHELVRFVARTEEVVVLDDASADAVYGSDPHVVREQVHSVLCMPVVKQGVLQAILYVENNAVSRAFTPARVSLLRVIAGQAAISIANAHLYEHLEQKVLERTRELAERNREIAAMLNSLEQGVFTIDEHLAIEPRYSAHLEQVLGARELAGKDALAVLFTGAGLEPPVLDNMRATLEFSFGFSPIFAEANRPHWVREFTRVVRPGGERRSFEVDWTLIADGNDSVCKILVAVRDVTLMKDLRAKAAAHARELDIVGQVLDVSLEQFQRTADAARRALEHSRVVLSEEPLSESAVGVAFRHLHTLKGNARMLGLGYLAGAVHAAEEPFGARLEHLPAAVRRARMLAGVAAALAALEEYEDVCRRKLGEALARSTPASDQLARAVTAELEAVKSGSIDPRTALAAIEAALGRVGQVPFANVLRSSSRVLPPLAAETGKLAPLVALEDFGETGLMLRPEVAEVLGGALVHVLTNALDHGLELPEERAPRGKPEQGTIFVSVVRSSAGTAVHVRDDGRGLALAALRARGPASDPDEVVADRIFDAGVTTAEAVTASSGRGVGLDAVRAGLRELGGDVRVVLTGPGAGGRRPFELVLELPPEVLPRRSLAPRRSEAPPRPSRHPGAMRESWPPGAS